MQRAKVPIFIFDVIPARSSPTGSRKSLKMKMGSFTCHRACVQEQTTGIITLQTGWSQAASCVWLLNHRQRILTEQNLPVNANLGGHVRRCQQAIRDEVGKLLRLQWHLVEDGVASKPTTGPGDGEASQPSTGLGDGWGSTGRHVQKWALLRYPWESRVEAEDKEQEPKPNRSTIDSWKKSLLNRLFGAENMAISPACSGVHPVRLDYQRAAWSGRVGGGVGGVQASGGHRAVT